MTTFFTSDSHFGHSGIIKFCDRPWTNTVDMDLELIDNWNSVVKQNDTVWHLGDVSWHRDKEINQDIFDSLNGKKHLIIGNHDPHYILQLGWESVSQYKEINVSGDRIILFHYPIFDWNGRFHKSYHLYGHVHGNYNPPIGDLAYDAGMDTNNYIPQRWDDIKKKLETPQQFEGWKNG